MEDDELYDNDLLPSERNENFNEGFIGKTQSNKNLFDEDDNVLANIFEA